MSGEGVGRISIEYQNFFYKEKLDNIEKFGVLPHLHKERGSGKEIEWDTE